MPEDLTLEKISNGATDFRKTEDGKIKFDMIKHLSLPGRFDRDVSPARWHIWSTYIFDPASGEWESSVVKVEFHYDPVLLVEEELVFLKKTGLVQDIAEKEEDREKKVEEIIETVKDYYENIPEAYETSEEKWSQMIDDLVEGLKPKLEKELEKLS